MSRPEFLAGPSFQFLTGDHSAETDVGRAEAVIKYAHERGLDVAHTKETGWLFWDGSAWLRDAEEDVKGLFFDLGRKGRLEAAQTHSAAIGDGDQPEDKGMILNAEAMRKRANGFQSVGVVGRAMEALASFPDVRRSINDFDADPNLLGVANGVVDLRTGALRPMTKEDLITKSISVAFDAGAKAPQWERFLGDVLIDVDGKPMPEMVDYMQRLVGYGITGHYREQCFVILQGKGANGKGVLTDTLTNVFRETTATAAFEVFEQRPSGSIPNDLAALAGARLVLASEGEAQRTMAEAVLKRVTGGDVISARFMRRDFFEFKPQFLLMMATNNKPNFRGQDEGLWRRVKLIEFRRYFKPEERDADLGARLVAEEAPGILAWAVAGAVKWYAGGLRDPQAIKDATAEYRRESDTLGQFMGDRLVVTETASDRLRLKDIKDAYHEFCEEWRVSPVQPKTLGQMLRERLTFVQYGSGSVVFTGVRLKTAAEMKADEVAELKGTRHLAEVEPAPKPVKAPSFVPGGAALEAVGL